MEWNDEIIAQLRALWDEGLSTAEIGRRLGITKNGVVGKAHRLDLPARPSPIRRDPTGAAPVRRPPAPRRVSGPTLAPLRAAAPAPRLVDSRPAEARLSEARVSEPEPPRLVAPVLRAVTAAPRPAGRFSACCWPIGEPGTPDFHFCGDAAISGKPYCAEHVAIAYVKVRDRREDAA